MQSPPRLMLLPGPKEARPNAAEDTGAVPGLWTPSHSLLLCPPEYDIEAAQEKDRQAFKPSNILQTQKTNCDGYAGLFEKMCRYQRGPAKGRQSQNRPPPPIEPSPLQSAMCLRPHASPET